MSISPEMYHHMYYLRISLFFVFAIGSLSISAQDTIAPIIIKPARDTSFTCNSNTDMITLLTTWYNNAAGAMATDNSGIVSFRTNITLAQAIAIFNNSLDVICGNKQKVDVTFTAVDTSGNTSPPSAASFFTTDVTGPTFNNVPNAQYNCIAGIRDTLINWIQNKAGYVATDACSNSVIWTNFQFAITTGSTVISSGGGSIVNGPYPMIPDGICNWKININFFVQDECGNQSITPGTTSFSVLDNVAPVFVNRPIDVTVQCNDIPPPTAPIVLDYCDKNIFPILRQTSSRPSDSTQCSYYNYTITRVWVATDKCGNEATHTHIITVRDTIGPAVTPAPTVHVSCKSFAANPDSIFILFADECSPSTVSFVDTTLSQSCTTVISRRYTLTDLCGNRTIYHQNIQVIQDTPPIISRPAQNKSFDCSSQEDFNTLLGNWVADRGGSMATAVCGSVKSFAAVKGSYDINNPTTFPGQNPSVLPVQVCPSALQGYLRYAEVDFVYYDSCGNAAATAAIFGVRDTLSPVMTNCQDSLVVILDSVSCAANITVNVPRATDNCTETASPVIKKVSAPVTSGQPFGNEAIVDSVTLRVGPFNPATAIPLNNGVLKISLVNMDIDDVTEFFNIMDEDGLIIGKTPLGPGQCSSVDFDLVLDQTKVLRWIQDGFISLKFVPNIIPGSPVLSINQICNSSRVEATISYDIDIVNTVKKSYSVNNGPIITLSGSTISVAQSLEKGRHSVKFILEDCAGNTSICETKIIIKDQTPPVIVCPIDMTSILKKGLCKDTVQIPINFVVNENCGSNRKYDVLTPTSSEAAAISFIYNEPSLKYIARNKQLVFTNVFPIRHINGKVTLQIDFFGDNNEAGEYFEILGPGGYLIGRTKISTGAACTQSLTEFDIPTEIFNTWIINNQVSVVASPNFGGDGINPCIPLTGNQTTDNTSYIRGRLRYSDATFSLKSTGNTIIANTVVPPGAATFPFVLNSGKNTITVTTTDDSGNSGSCTFDILVKDEEKPVAKCKSAVITLHPSGTQPSLLTPVMINNGSTDNCGIQNMRVVPASFDCSKANTDVSVLFIVEDLQGNMDTCISIVRVKSFDLKPTFSAGLCANDTLKLFANLPPADVPGTYTYHWDGPGDIEFFTENPFIINPDENFNGVYVLTVKGFNGCTSIGSMVVNIKPLTNPVLSANNRDICSGTDLILSTSNYSGEIVYQWYEGIFPTGVLLKSTQIPEYILRPATGIHFYYVIAKGPDCSSNPSPLLKATILSIPMASVNDLFVSVCEGESIVLGSPVSNPNFIYQWTGPSGYVEQGKSPRVITNASNIHAGNYALVINNGGCLSDTAITRVAILEKPAQPVIASADIFCEGAIFTLVASGSTNAERFDWFRNGALFTTTQDNNLIFNNAQSALQGTWTVRAIKGNCTSQLSAGKFIAIDHRLEIGAINTGPVCKGDSIRLQATFVPNASYKWQGPVANIPSVFDPLIPGVPGDYSVVITTPTGCQNNANTTVSVINVPEITALSNTSKACMVSGDSIRFFPSFFPNSNAYTYRWTGPNGYTSTEREPKLTNLSAKDTGFYQLVIMNGKCPSNIISTKVAFNLIPAKPVVTSNPFYCEGDTMTIVGPNGIMGAEYIWNTPLGQFITPMNRLVIPNSAMVNSGFYGLEIKAFGCTSPLSGFINIDVKSRPALPSITSNSPVCFGDTIRLSAGNPRDIIYLWKGPIPINDKGSVVTIPNANRESQGTYSLSVSQDGCRSSDSTSLMVIVRDEIKTPAFVLNSLSVCKTSPSGPELCLHPSS
ncbi:MAG: hypothetical protein WAU01_00145, partial [Saprospiraceae bacterium]